MVVLHNAEVLPSYRTLINTPQVRYGMPGPKYKQRCASCKKNMVLMYSSRQFPICTDCHMKQIEDPVTDPVYKELLDIPRELYVQSSFLRNIKRSYLQYHVLSEKQIEVFKKVAGKLKKGEGMKEEARKEETENGGMKKGGVQTDEGTKEQTDKRVAVHRVKKRKKAGGNPV